MRRTSRAALQIGNAESDLVSFKNKPFTSNQIGA